MISVGLIGCGAIAESGHLPMLLHHGRFRLAAVCDIDPRRAELLSQQAGGVPQYNDWRELLASEKLQAAVLALPPDVSPEVVVECLYRKLAILDEKPLAGTVDQGRRLAQAVEEMGGIYQVGFVLRYGDWVQRIRRLAPLLGSPLEIQAEVYDEQYDPNDSEHFSRIQSFLANSSAMTHEGAHVVDYVRLWNSSPWTQVHASAERTSPEFEGPNVWNAAVSLADRSTLKLKIAWLLPELPPSTIRIDGPAGQLRFNCLTGRGWHNIDGHMTSLAMSPLAPEWNRQYDAYAEAIDQRRASVATIVDGLNALELTAACEASARAGHPVTPEYLESQREHSRVDAQHATASRNRLFFVGSNRQTLAGPPSKRTIE